MSDKLTFFQRYQQTASTELTAYFHPNGVVSTEAEMPTREDVIASTMRTPITIVNGQSRRTYYPSREEAETMVDAAFERARNGPFPGRTQRPFYVVGADGIRHQVDG